MPPELAGYPVTAAIQHQATYRRWLPLVKWLLLIPHYVVLVFLAIGAVLAEIGAAFAILFTRSYPQGLFRYVLGVQRWAWRVSAYFFLMTDAYPPFTLQPDAAYPTEFEISYPGEMERWRPFVQWSLSIPYLAVARILSQLGGLLAFFALFAILFTERYPRGMFDIVLTSLRWQARGNAYAGFMVTRYPPFVWG